MQGTRRDDGQGRALDVWLDFVLATPGFGEADFAALCARHPSLDRELRALRTQGEAGAPASAPTDMSERLAALTRPAPRGARYERKEELGRGGMGVVYRVQDLELDRSLALKEMARGSAGEHPLAAARFLEEAKITAQLDHPGIVPVHELGVDEHGRLFFSMKLVRGRNLRVIFDLVQQGQEGWTLTRALGVMLRVCEAMAYAHSRGVIHRDLKPSNVMVGSFGEVHVMDWGLARAMGSADLHDIRIKAGIESASLHTERRTEREDTPDSPLVTMDGAVVGTPAYMAPEQARGEIERLSPRADVYSIGAMLYQLLTGVMPYQPSSGRISKHTLLARVIDGPPAPIAGLAPRTPPELVAICERAMARDAALRYPDTLALGEDLRAYLEGRVVRAYQTGPWAELSKWTQRNKFLAASMLGIVVVLAVGLCIAWILKGRSDRLLLANERANSALAAKTREAEARRTEAELRADEVLRLSAFQRLADLQSEAGRLWPAAPEFIPAYEDWLARADELIRSLDPGPEGPGHRAQLAKLLERAILLTEEERKARQRQHPLYDALERQRKRVAALRIARDIRKGTAQLAPVPLNSSEFPTDAGRLEALARPLVDPGRSEFGREATGLVLARLALERVEDESSAARAEETLAWALHANGFDEEARAEMAAALEAAPDDERGSYQESSAALDIAVRAAVDGSALSEGERKLAMLEDEVSAGPGFRFAVEEDAWWYAQLEKLVSAIVSFADPERGMVQGVSEEHGWGIEQRRAFAASLLERSIEGSVAAALWAEAVSSIADPSQCPRYGGLRIVPQIGLLPIGRDPDSGLWEFAHLQTGEPPSRNADGNLELGEETGLVFVLLPGGTFIMGAQAEDPEKPNFDPHALGDEGPPHSVVLSPFFFSKYEMTQGQWQRVTSRNPSFRGPHNWLDRFSRSGRRVDLALPVEQVSWTSCAVVLTRLGLGLPSEAQWEYGARAGTTTVWWTGDDKQSLQGMVNLADSYALANLGVGWVHVETSLDDGNTVQARVGSYPANGFGLHEVIGNVWEWCGDGYAPYRAGLARDPLVPSAGSEYCVERGGSYSYSATNARSACRGYDSAGLAVNNLGVRPARLLVMSPTSPSDGAK